MRARLDEVIAAMKRGGAWEVPCPAQEAVVDMGAFGMRGSAVRARIHGTRAQALALMECACRCEAGAAYEDVQRIEARLAAWRTRDMRRRGKALTSWRVQAVR